LPRLVRYEAEQDGDHEFCTYDLDAEPGGDLVEELANLVRQLYVDTSAFAKSGRVSRAV
jgi:hypothetical protein